MSDNCADTDKTYAVIVKLVKPKAVLVKIKGTGIQTWLPKSKVTFPETLNRGDVLEVAIPGWIIKNEYGEPF